MFKHKKIKQKWFSQGEDVRGTFFRQFDYEWQKITLGWAFQRY